MATSKGKGTARTTNKPKRSPENTRSTEGPGHGQGSTVAPTAEAAAHEAERHADEEAHGHFAAGVDGRKRAIDPKMHDAGSS